MNETVVEALPNLPVGQQRIEFVERKGLGHPDSICDAVMESVAIALSEMYMETAGRLLHFNLDKALLVAGQTTPLLGGGTVEAPMRLIFGDRATQEFDGQHFDIRGVIETAASRWLNDNLRFVDPAKHFIFQNELKAGAPELVDIFSRDRMVANDTSAVVGYAPLTEAEIIVLAAERFLNSADFKSLFPETGEDIKVMGVRHNRQLSLTVAVALVDRFLPDANTYFERVEAAKAELHRHLDAELTHLDSVDIHINALDQPNRGAEGMYLTVLGTSAESGDGGQVGRGNAVNGVINLSRPTSNEAAAGKNPVSHVGKIYNLLAFEIANDIYESSDAIDEAYVWLCSQIGRPINAPWFSAVNVVLAPDALPSDVREPIKETVREHLDDLDTFCERLTRGDLPIC